MRRRVKEPPIQQISITTNTKSSSLSKGDANAKTEHSMGSTSSSSTTTNTTANNTAITTSSKTASSIVSAAASSALILISNIREKTNWKHLVFVVLMILLWSFLWLLMRKIFPNHRYHHLLQVPEIKSLLEDAPAPHNDNYVVFVSNANGYNRGVRGGASLGSSSSSSSSSTATTTAMPPPSSDADSFESSLVYNVAMGRSTESAEHALLDALSKMPLHSARWPWFKVDVVTAVKTLRDFDHSVPHGGSTDPEAPGIGSEEEEDIPSWWFGLALDWEAGFVFLPDEVQSQGLVDSNNRIQWNHVGLYASKRRQLEGRWPRSVMEDDAFTLESIDVLHTNAVLCDFSQKQIVSLYHGHRLFSHLTHTLLVESAQEAGRYLVQSVKPDGRHVSWYKPRSNVEPLAPVSYDLTRHVGSVYAMACLVKETPNDKKLLQALDRSISFLLDNYVKDCSLPYQPSAHGKCIWDYASLNDITGAGPGAAADGSGASGASARAATTTSRNVGAGTANIAKAEARITKLNVNALALLALVQTMQSTGNTQFLQVARSIADYIKGCQRDDGSFVQRISVPSNRLLEEDPRQQQQGGGEAVFALTKLYAVVKELQGHQEATITEQVQDPDEDWLLVADRAADNLITQDGQRTDAEFVVNPWLLHGLAELGQHYHQQQPAPAVATPKKSHLLHMIRAIKLASNQQVHETNFHQDKDRLGIFGSSTSALETAATTEGLCASYDVLVQSNHLDVAKMIMETTSLSVRFQLQQQYRPEKAMYMRNPRRILGGFYGSLTTHDMSNDYTQHNLCSLLCMARLLKEQEVAWNT